MPPHLAIPAGRPGSVLLNGSSPKDWQRSWASLPAALAALALLVTFAMVVWTFIVRHKVPGDLGDARFNMFVLEHTFRRLGGGISWASPQNFYPFPGTLFYSDTHAGSALFYALFRLLRFSELQSFTLWFFTGLALTYLAAAYAFIRLGFTPLTALLAALIFAFSLPVLSQAGHAQLVYRFGIPLAWFCLDNYVRSGRVNALFGVVFWTAWQMLCAIYLGVFLVLMLVPAVLWMTVCYRRTPRSIVRDSLADLRAAWRDRLVATAARLWLTLAAAWAALVLLVLYRWWGSLYGFGRTWGEIEPMVPRLQSYLILDALPYW